MTRTSRVFLVVVMAVVAAATTKVVTHVWRLNSESAYEVARSNLKYDETSTNGLTHDAVGDGVDGASVATNELKQGFFDRVGKAVKSSYSNSIASFKKPVREARHIANHMPAYVKALIVFQLSVLVDAVLVWIVVSLFLLKVLFWAFGKLFNNWVDGPSTEGKAVAAEMMGNGDVVIHVEQLKRG